LNSFGRIFRIHIFGESHGESAGMVIDGCPAGLSLVVDDFLPDMERRKGGTQKGTTPRQEEDIPIFKSGIFNNKTTGAPITILFENKNIRSSDYEKQRAVPRPGHADFVAHKKFGGFEDYRGSGHFSGRLTVALVAAGVNAKKLLSSGKSGNQKISVESSILEIGGEKDLEKGFPVWVGIIALILLLYLFTKFKQASAIQQAKYINEPSESDFPDWTTDQS